MNTVLKNVIELVNLVGIDNTVTANGCSFVIKATLVRSMDALHKGLNLTAYYAENGIEHTLNLGVSETQTRVALSVAKELVNLQNKRG